MVIAYLRACALLALLAWAGVLVAQDVPSVPPVSVPVTPPAPPVLAPPVTAPLPLPHSEVPSVPPLTPALPVAAPRPAVEDPFPTTESAAPPPPPGPGPFWRSTAIPAACVLAGEIRSTTACDVIEAARLGWDLSQADGSREMLRILAAEAAKKTVFFTFPREMDMGAKVALVRKIYAAEAKQFDALLSQVQLALVDQQKATQLRTQYAIQDSADVARLKEDVHRENSASVDNAAKYVESHPRSQGVQGECRLACHQAVAASRGINVFD